MYLRCFSRLWLILALLTIPGLASIASAQSVIADGVWEMAGRGETEKLWTQIRQTSGDSTAIAALHQQIDQHQQLDAQRRSETAQSFNKHMTKLAEAMAEDDIREAMSEAVQARGLSNSPEQFLTDPRIKSLIERAEAAASQAEADQKWFEALVIYRRLNWLVDDFVTYDEPFDRIARKLRILSMYVPDTYHVLSEAYAISIDEDPPVKWEGEEDLTWREELKGVTRSMLMQAMTRAADKHVEPSSYDRLYIGGLETLRIFIRMQQLGDTFPGLADKTQVDRFDEYLVRQHQELVASTQPMTYTQCATRLRNLLDYAKQTVHLPESVIVFEFAVGAMDTLDDYSTIYWPSDKERFERTTKQEFIGVGVQITLNDDKLTVAGPLLDTPAHKAGLKAGDRIVTIDGKSTTGISLDQAITAITGKANTTVTLGIVPAGSDVVVEKVLTRKRIHIPSVKGFERQTGGDWRYIVDEQDRIGMVRVEQFGPDTADELDRAVRQMRKTGGLNGLIVDLRFNGGGRLDAARNLSNRFLDQGLIVSVGDDHYRADRKYTYGDFPVVVLINNTSASASEILAGCLQDHGRALIVGENSYGKGSVQEIFYLGAYEAYLKVTTRYYKLPSDRIIHRRPHATEWGVRPDVAVRMTDEQVERFLRARTLLDTLREEDDPEIDPTTLINVPGDDEEAQAELEAHPMPKSARQMLAEGFDPQMEVAILLIKAKLLDLPTLAEKLD